MENLDILKRNLEELYDVVNDIFRDKNIDVFYTKEELEELKKDPKNIFL